VIVDLRSALGSAMCIAALGAAACGGDTPLQPPPPADAPRLVCPQPVTARSVDGEATAVTYPQVTLVGGQLPVTMACEPPSAELFPVGQTVVTCRVSDSLTRQDACSFTVTVEPPPRTTATRFIAFGDSISDGVLGFARFAVGDPGPPVGYAFKLKTLLQERYTAQTFQMTDEGIPGESITTGQARLAGALSRDNPEVVLLFEGINDLNGARDAAIPAVVNGLRSMIRTIKGRGMAPFVATFLPQRRGAQRAFAVNTIVPANEQVRAMVAAEGAVLVDLYPVFEPDIDTLIGPDGLHPTEAGYQKMAETFFATIRERLETAPVLTTSSRLLHSPRRVER
jgi:lysophospholipase L1-like esterase